jgi:hypothetical protein
MDAIFLRENFDCQQRRSERDLFTGSVGGDDANVWQT